MPAIHTGLGFWSVSCRWDYILEPDGHIMGSMTALWGRTLGVLSEFSPCSHKEDRKSS